MSSHHIVRENQEPALLIVDAHAISFEKVQELLEWMPTVVVLSTEVDAVLDWGIKIDVVLVPLNEMSKWQNKLSDQAPLKFISYSQSDNPILTAFYFLVAAKHVGVNALLPGTVELETLHPMNHLDVEAFIAGTRWCLVRSGTFEKWYAAGTRIKFFPDEVKFDTFDSQQSNFLAESDGVISLRSKGLFWVGEEL